MDASIWTKTGLALVFTFFIYRAFTQLRNNKDLLSKENFSKSFSTMGVLILGLIVFIAFLVMMLRLK